MLSLSPSYRGLLWGRDDWSTLLSERARELLAAAHSPSLADSAAELAQLCEGIVPDSAVAAELYACAYGMRAEVGWAERAHTLAEESGAFTSMASIAGMVFDSSGNSWWGREMAMAWLDAGMPSLSLDPLQRALADVPDDRVLIALEKSVSDSSAKHPDVLRELEAKAAELGPGPEAASCLLQAARIVRLGPGKDEAILYLMRAFDADSTNPRVVALLETFFIDDSQWKRLGNLYRIQTERAMSPLERVHAYRRFGTRLVLASDSQGTGMRYLQSAATTIYQEEMELVPQLVAILGLVTEKLVQAGATPGAVRLLAQGLAHPRSDDEAMWIVNRGLALAQGDQALRRTVASFMSVKEKLLDKAAA